MKKAARAIIRLEDDYVFIYRNKNINGKQKEYYTTVGGHLDEDETYEEACVREVYEELGINVQIKHLFHEEWFEEIKKHEKFYIVNYINGELGTGKGEEFRYPDIDKYGAYKIVRINKDKLQDYNILPISIKEKLIRYNEE